MEYNFQNVGLRLRSERAKRGWSQDVFLAKLAEKGVRVARNRLSLIENGERQAFTLEVLLASCELFGMDVGHLLGEYDCKSISVQSVHELTGLSEEAIEELKWHRGEYSLGRLSTLIMDRNFWELLEIFRAREDMGPDILAKKQETVALMFEAAKNANDLGLKERYEQTAYDLQAFRWRYKKEQSRAMVLLSDILDQFLPNI